MSVYIMVEFIEPSSDVPEDKIRTRIIMAILVLGESVHVSDKIDWLIQRVDDRRSCLHPCLTGRKASYFIPRDPADPDVRLGWLGATRLEGTHS